MGYKNTALQMNKDNDKVVDMLRSTRILFKNFKPSERVNIYTNSICTKSDKIIANYITKKLHNL